MITVAEMIDGELMVRIPRKMADAIGLSDGCRVRIAVRDRGLSIKVPRYTLEELVAQITEENRHDEVDWGPPVGNEFW